MLLKHFPTEYDLDYLDIPSTLKPLDKTFIVTHSLIENGQYLVWNKFIVEKKIIGYEVWIDSKD